MYKRNILLPIGMFFLVTGFVLSQTTGLDFLIGICYGAAIVFFVSSILNNKKRS